MPVAKFDIERFDFVFSLRRPLEPDAGHAPHANGRVGVAAASPTGITAPRPAAGQVMAGLNPAARPSIIGSVLAGQYVIESVIPGGQGTHFGVVCKARDLIL